MDDIGKYLQEIGRIPLLTPEQEVLYSQQVQKMMSVLAQKEALALQLHRPPSIKEWALSVQLAEVQLNEIVRQGQRAKQKMVEANLRLVVAIAQIVIRHL